VIDFCLFIPSIHLPSSSTAIHILSYVSLEERRRNRIVHKTHCMVVMEWSATAVAPGGDGGQKLQPPLLLRPPSQSHHVRSASLDQPFPAIGGGKDDPGLPVRPARRRRPSSSDLSSAEENCEDPLPKRDIASAILTTAKFHIEDGPPQRCGSVPPSVHSTLSPSLSPRLAQQQPQQQPGQRALFHRQRALFTPPPPQGSGGGGDVDLPFGHQRQQPTQQPQRNSWKNRANKWQWLWHKKDPAVKESEEGGGGSSRDSSTSSCKSAGGGGGRSGLGSGLGGSFRHHPKMATMGVKRNHISPHISCPDISSASSDSESLSGASPTIPFKVSISSLFARPSASSSRQQRLLQHQLHSKQQQQNQRPPLDLDQRPRLLRKRTLTGTRLGGSKDEADDVLVDTDDFLVPISRYFFFYKPLFSPLSCYQQTFPGSNALGGKMDTFSLASFVVDIVAILWAHLLAAYIRMLYRRGFLPRSCLR
jgi:hypothetical protein